jgi:hypothetical protein
MLRAYLLDSSNGFQNLGPKIWETILHQESKTIYKSLQPLLYFLSRLHNCIKNHVLLFILSITFRSADQYSGVYFCAIGCFFPSVERLGVETVSCWRVVFFNLAKKKSRFGVGFRNSWRCSNSQ